MGQSASELTIQVGHSPDPDDAFMFHGIASGRVPTSGYRIVQVLKDIETLNRLAMEGRIEVTAASIHAYAHLADRYALLSCGASMGDGYGPIVVTREPRAPEDLKRMTIAVPGLLTSATLALRLAIGAVEVVPMPFDLILDAVARGEREAGLIIHEGQLTYGAGGAGLHKAIDLGVWWKERTGLPLPLGGNIVRRDLGERVIADLHAILKRSIAWGLAHRAEALAYAEQFGRGLRSDLADRFVGMYVNDLTLDYGDRGRRAVQAFLDAGAEAGLVPRRVQVAFAS
jgi:1,4-dihydroxy-6-naphthoate synthase